MVKITVTVNGMMCGMCEAHVNDAVRAAFNVKKVTSSHSKHQTVIVAESEPDADKLREVIAKTGYEVGDIECEPYEKRGLFGRR